MNVLADLNDEQRRAVETDGPLIITAGPGTGKTKTLTNKIVYLLAEKGVAADDILALTFTNKAGEEMKERVKSMSGQGKLPFIGTFHGLAMRLLSERGEIKIVSEEEQKEIVRGVLKELNIKRRIREALIQISKQKSAGATDTLVEAYNQQLRARGLYDFDDLLLEMLKAVESGEIAKRWEHVLVDEFQDTNKIQYELIKKLAGENICVIGDPLQSIYAFRGGDPRIFEQFKQDFPRAQEITLVKNYRSASCIIEASSGLFPQAPRLEPQISSAGQVALVTTLNERTEAAWVLAEIGRRMGGMDLNMVGVDGESSSARFSDFAVIYRVHEIGRQLELLFAEHGIPYQVIGGALPHEQSDIQHDKVVLLTMHAAKGLEFRYVFVAGFEDGLIPYTRRGESEAELAEETRLLYVAMTRAKEQLYLLRPLHRRRQKTVLSRFQQLLSTAAILNLEDAVIAEWQNKQTKLREKKRQLSLL